MLFGSYSLKYDFEEDSCPFCDDEDGYDQSWLPKLGLNFGLAL